MSCAAFILAVACARPSLAQPVDHGLQPMPIPPVYGQTIAPKYQTLFTPVARWGGAVHWVYNHANAPQPFADDKEGVVAQLRRAAGKWSVSCGIAFVYDGETSTAPGAGPIDELHGQLPDGISVVGWGTTDPSLGAWTSAWYSASHGTLQIFDADVTLSVANIASLADLDRLMTHEWGHVLGLDHSDVDATIMSGPPLSSYNALVDPQADDLRGCRCLYGLPSGMSAPYACSVPSRIDARASPVGEATRAQPVTLTNSGNAPLAIESERVDGTQFRHASGCTAGTVVMPGASCAIQVEATPTALGTVAGNLTLFTNDGAYAFALVADGVVAPPPTVEVVEFYNPTLDHYFITWLGAEIAKLDAGITQSRWVRTGYTFRAFASAQAGTSPICRFYVPPADGNSHFFGRGAAECKATALAHPDFVLEDPQYMHMPLPVAGACTAGTRPVYRVFDNRDDTNHRYTVDRAVRDLMVDNAWVAEGDGPDLVAMCAPV
ncbi:MAG: choice-of-anchor D domain-containing protein [Burkholderiales bacterium]